MKKYTISESEYAKVAQAERKCKDKRTWKKLKILLLRFEGMSIRETAKQMECSESKVKRIVAEYKKDGLEEFMRNKYAGNHRNLSKEEEKEILERFEKLAQEGHIVTGWEIKKAFDERLGRDTGRGYIYIVLKRHGWRKVMPRSKHPQKANEEAMEASKKLTIP